MIPAICGILRYLAPRFCERLHFKLGLILCSDATITITDRRQVHGYEHGIWAYRWLDYGLCSWRKDRFSVPVCWLLSLLLGIVLSFSFKLFRIHSFQTLLLGCARLIGIGAVCTTNPLKVDRSDKKAHRVLLSFLRTKDIFCLCRIYRLIQGIYWTHRR